VKLLLDNIIFSKSHNGGISNYWFELCKYVQEHHPGEVRYFDYVPNYNYHRSKLHLPDEALLPQPKAGIITGALPLIYKSKEHFIFHSSYYRGLKGSPNVTEITTVHDFIHDYCFPPLRRKLHNAIKYPAIKRSSGIICISRNTYKDLLKFCPPSKKQKIEIIYNGVSNAYYVLEDKDKLILKRYGLQPERPYLLFIGSRAPYKNFNLAAELLKQLPGYDFVIVGSPFTIKEVNLIGAELLKRTHLFTDLEDYKLNVLYNFAHALIYPSDYEGFGIPVIEAMKAGCPVLALNHSSIAEIAAGNALLFNDKKIDVFKNGVTALENQDKRDELIMPALLHSRNFSWEKCTQQTYDFYSSFNI
jgi:glycosyltransferase involved in cell wall biosynthesis